MSLSSLAAIPELELRAGGACTRLAIADGAVVAELDALLGMLPSGASPVAYLACALVLARDATLAARLGALARAAEHRWVCAFLSDAPPARALHARGHLPDARAPARTVRVDRTRPAEGVGAASVFRDVPHDEHRFRVHFERSVVRHPSPIVVERLLASPTTRIGDVLRVASRRPTTPALLSLVATSGRWMAQLDVREALVKNPFAPTRLSLLYLPTLRRAAWAELAGVSRAHALVRAGARMLLRGRAEP